MNTTERFSNRVDDYVRSRPHYPPAVLQQLEDCGALPPHATIADIGSGTGISAKLFLEAGHTVFGIEPNAPMREAGENYLQAFSQFNSIDATAEQTTLPNASVDLIIAAQAFHWFDQAKTKTEWQRILKPGGYVAIIWNDRLTKDTDFSSAYEDVLNYFGTDYKKVNHRNIQERATETFDAFFGANNWSECSIDNHQDLTFEGLHARLMSSSYVPQKEHPDYEFMRYVLKKVFVRYQENGTVRMNYNTCIYYGTIH